MIELVNCRTVHYDSVADLLAGSFTLIAADFDKFLTAGFDGCGNTEADCYAKPQEKDAFFHILFFEWIKNGLVAGGRHGWSVKYLSINPRAYLFVLVAAIRDPANAVFLADRVQRRACYAHEGAEPQGKETFFHIVIGLAG